MLAVHRLDANRAAASLHFSRGSLRKGFFGSMPGSDVSDPVEPRNSTRADPPSLCEP